MPLLQMGLKGDAMEWHFGYNCENYLPTLGKCRWKISHYNERADLLADKWLKTRDFIVYTQCSPHKLIAQLESGEVQAKRIKKPKDPERDGFWRLRTRCSWDWDNCGLSDTGGQCVEFRPHHGHTITCMMDLRHIDADHPNLAMVPSGEDVRLLEDRISELLGKNPVVRGRTQAD